MKLSPGLCNSRFKCEHLQLPLRVLGGASQLSTLLVDYGCRRQLHLTLEELWRWWQSSLHENRFTGHVSVFHPSAIQNCVDITTNWCLKWWWVYWSWGWINVVSTYNPFSLYAPRGSKTFRRPKRSLHSNVQWLSNSFKWALVLGRYAQMTAYFSGSSTTIELQCWSHSIIRQQSWWLQL